MKWRNRLYETLKGAGAVETRHTSIDRTAKNCENHISAVNRSTEYRHIPNNFSGAPEAETDDHNAFVNQYNTQLEKVKADPKLENDFETICEERKSILMIDGGLTDDDAEEALRSFDTLSNILMSV